MVSIKVGDLVTFNCNGKIANDVVRDTFVQVVRVQPYAENYEKPAVVLTENSWCFVDEILTVNGEEISSLVS